MSDRIIEKIHSELSAIRFVLSLIAGTLVATLIIHILETT